jgi:FG-GAP-like repeat
MMKPVDVSQTLVSLPRPCSRPRKCVAGFASRAAVSVAVLSLSVLAHGQELDPEPVPSGPDVLAQARIPFSNAIVDPNNPKNPCCKALRDLSGDGQYDIVVASQRDGGMYWYEYPSWAKHAIRSSGSWTTDMKTADIDKDGDADIIVPDSAGIKWYRSRPDNGNPRIGSQWTAFNIGAAGANNHDVEVGDINRDTRVDVVTRRKRGFATNVWLQNRPFSWTHVVASTRAGEGTALGDIDHDGDLDIAHNGFWLENTNGAGTSWTQHTIATNWPLEVGVLVADVDRNGRRDIVLAPSESASGRLSWYSTSHPRSGPWVEHVVDGTVSYMHTFKAADMDKDGDLDLVTAEMHQSSDPDQVSVYRNNGDGRSWTQQVVATTGSHNLRIGDIDRDGDIDIMGANWDDSASSDSAVVRVWRNKLAP